MISLAVGIYEDVNAALPYGGDYYRTEDRKGNAVVPSFWLHADSSADLNTLQDATLVYLDLFRGNRQEIDDDLEKLGFLRAHDVPGVGCYRRRSVAVQDDEEGGVHATIIISCTHFPGGAA